MKFANFQDYVLHVTVCARYAHCIVMADTEVEMFRKIPGFLADRQEIISKAEKLFPGAVAEMQCPVHGYALRSYYMGAATTLRLFAVCEDDPNSRLPSGLVYPKDIIETYDPEILEGMDAGHSFDIDNSSKPN